LDPELFAESRSIIKIFIFRIGDGSVADPGCLSRIRNFPHPGSWTSDPGSNKTRGGLKKFF